MDAMSDISPPNANVGISKREPDPQRKQKLDTLRKERVDSLVGAKAIALFADLPVRQVFRLLEDGTIPARKAGRLWVTTQSAVRRVFDPEA
jgi:hypothetical protein